MLLLLTKNPYIHKGKHTGIKRMPARLPLLLFHLPEQITALS